MSDNEGSLLQNHLPEEMFRIPRDFGQFHFGDVLLVKTQVHKDIDEDDDVEGLGLNILIST